MNEKNKSINLPILFGCIRSLVAKTDAVEIMLSSLNGDVVDNWRCMDLVPDKYNEMEVIGFGQHDIILEDGDSKSGIEFYLNDIGYPKED